MIWLAALAFVRQELCTLNTTVFTRSQEHLRVGKGHFKMWKVT